MTLLGVHYLLEGELALGRFAFCLWLLLIEIENHDGAVGEFCWELEALWGGGSNVFGNVASIVTPLVIGYLVSELHSFNAALVFVGCSALMAMVCYLFVVGDIKRMELQK